MIVKKVTKGKSTQSRPEKGVPVKVVDYFRDMESGLNVPVTESYIQRKADELVDWARNTEALKLTDFFLERNIPTGYLYRWKEKHPCMAAAHDQALVAIGNRREKGGLKKAYDSSLVKETMAIYDPEFKAFLAWKTKLAKQEEAQGNINVIIQKFPELEAK